MVNLQFALIDFLKIDKTFATVLLDQRIFDFLGQPCPA